MFAYPCKDKKTDTFWDGILQAITAFDFEIHTIVSDRESSLSKQFRNRFKKEFGVTFRLLSSYHKSNLSEIFIRIVKSRLSTAMSTEVELARKEYKERGESMPLSVRMRLSRSWTNKLDGVIEDLNDQPITRKSKLKRKDVSLANAMQAIKDIYDTKLPYDLFSYGLRKNWPKRLTKRLFAHKIDAPVLISKAALLKVSLMSS